MKFTPAFMLYLNEDAVNNQIQICRQQEDLDGVKCPACAKVKNQDRLCPLGKARISTVAE